MTGLALLRPVSSDFWKAPLERVLKLLFVGKLSPWWLKKETYHKSSSQGKELDYCLWSPGGGGGVHVGILGGGVPPSSSNPDSIPDPKM